MVFYQFINQGHQVSMTTHRVGGNRKRSLQSTNADKKSLETVLSIAICRQSGDKWQSKTLFLTIFDLRPSMVLTFSIAAYPVWTRFCNNHRSQTNPWHRDEEMLDEDKHNTHIKAKTFISHYVNIF